MANVIVIGGGAAGMIASGRAAEKGHTVHLYEKNDRLGKKIYITGKGRCNITNDSDIDTHLNNIPSNPYFMYSAFYRLDSERTKQFFQELGLQTKTERGNRVFPVSDKAGDVARALQRYLKKNGVVVHTNTTVKHILIENGVVKGIALENKKVFAEKVIVCTGGLSYPGTGSTGDGYAMAKQAGHHVTKLYPSLVPLKAKEKWCQELMGLSLKNCAIAVKNKAGKVIYKDFGEMLFTHFGVSGPMILSASRHMIKDLEEENYTIEIDLKPALEEKILDNRILRDFQKYSNKDIRNALDELLPQKIIPVVILCAKIEPTKKVHDITKEERKRLVKQIKCFTVCIYGTTGFQEAVVTCGGVCVDEIDPATMESKIVKGLYFAGEVLDVDAYTGGFNLQIAFSTGYTAGES